MSKKIIIPEIYDYKDGVYDLDSLFRYAVQAPFELPAKAILYACVMGANDESDWHWIFRANKQLYYATGGCDYTGWDCQSWGEVKPVKSLAAALKEAPHNDGNEWGGSRPIRQWLKDQIDGKSQIGVVDSI